MLNGKIFRGLHRSSGIVGQLDAPHDLQFGGGEHQRHLVLLFHADPVLAGNAAAELDARLKNLAAGLQHPVDVAGAPPVEGD